MSNHVEPAKRVFFFERSDGKILAVENQEAYNIYHRRPQNLSQRLSYKLIGTGDGHIYAQARLDAQAAGRVDIEEAKKILAKGQQDELEACRGKIIPPTPGALDKIIG